MHTGYFTKVKYPLGYIHRGVLYTCREYKTRTVTQHDGKQIINIRVLEDPSNLNTVYCNWVLMCLLSLYSKLTFYLSSRCLPPYFCLIYHWYFCPYSHHKIWGWFNWQWICQQPALLKYIQHNTVASYNEWQTSCHYYTAISPSVPSKFCCWLKIHIAKEAFHWQNLILMDVLLLNDCN